ncbi:GSCFA family protein [compost metagenome]
MTLHRISGAQAFENLTKNLRRSAWPDGRKPRSRLEGIAAAMPVASFYFAPGDQILTLGSCFAREIEKHLSELGFDLPMLKVNVPPEERITKTPNDVLNKYSVHSMENEIRWAFEGLPFDERTLYLETEAGLWLDPHLGINLPPAPFERVADRRAQAMAAMRDLATSKVFIITLGLAESWFDLETGLYLNGAPPPSVRNRYSERFALDVLSYDDVLQSLERIHDLVRKYGASDTKILITTSPVPFKATFTGEDALIANTYSKSVQRAACGAFAARHDNVDYFPSYEIVTLTDRSRAYTNDNIHVNPEVVGFIMDTVLHAYCPSLGVQPKQPEEKAAPAPQPTESDKERLALIQIAQRKPPLERLEMANMALRKGHNDKAATIFSTLLPAEREAFDGPAMGRIYTDYGVALLRAKKPERGVEILELALHYLPDDARLNYKLGLGYARVRNSHRALHYLREALRLDPSVADHHWRLGAELVRHRRLDEARERLETALSIDPAHEAARKEMARLETL